MSTFADGLEIYESTRVNPLIAIDFNALIEFCQKDRYAWNAELFEVWLHSLRSAGGTLSGVRNFV